MKNLAVVAAVIALGAAVYLQREAIFGADESPDAAAVAVANVPSRDGKVLLHLARGVQQYCVKEFHLASCLNYAIECQNDCASLLSKDTRNKIFVELNKYRVANGQKPLEDPRRRRAASARY